MASQNRKRAKLLVARSKRTGEKYPVRMTHLAGADSSQRTESERPRSFHYLSKDKGIVCRCYEVRHFNYRQVHNPEIEEPCRGFFPMYRSATTCSREQWRAMDTETAEPLKNPFMLETSHSPSTSGRTSLRRSLFEYDSPSVVEFLLIRERQCHDSGTTRVRHALRQRSSQARPSSLDTVDMRHLSNGPYGGADVPEDVWRVSRPSVYLEQHNTRSFTSTPLGSSATIIRHSVYHKPTTRTQAPEAHSTFDSWYGLAHSPGPTVLDGPYEMPNDSANHVSQRNTRRFTSKFDVISLQVSSSETTRSPAEGSAAAIGDSAHVAELACSRTVVELDDTPSHFPSHHSLTLRELEGRSVERVSELAWRSLTMPPTMSKDSRSSYRLSRRIDQHPFDVRLPCQGEFFTKWVETCTLLPNGSCSLCQNSFSSANEITTRLTCGHSIHRECLLLDWRVSDLGFGHCPICGMALCERTLQDHIDTDREAIFGQTFTDLQVEERIEFPSHGQVIICWSEEVVAAAQLRLLKDYVDYHADELYAQWRQSGFEPDWYNAVAVPVVQLFKGWTVPMRNCRYFVDCDAFYKLIVWAELVRLMNTVRDRVNGA
jgi:hypothetical protein